MRAVKQFLSTQYFWYDRLILLALIFPLSAVLLGLKWYVVNSVTPFSPLSLLDFLRMNVAYFALILLWCALLLQRSASLNAIRIVVIAYFLVLVAESLLSTGEILVTGAQIPFDLALYGMWSIGFGMVSLDILETFFLYVIPGFLIWLALAKWRLLGQSEGRKLRMPKLRPLILVLGTLCLALLPPLHPDLELNTSRPSFPYKVIEQLKKATLADANAAGGDSVALLPEGVVDRGSSVKKPNLVFIVLESVSARATSLGNPALLGLTPHLQRLAASSLHYDRAYAVVPHTSKALVAMFCGTEPFYRYPIFESHLGVPARCLASLLGEQGYETAFFQSPTERFENRRGLVAQMGFRTFFAGESFPASGFELANYFGYEDAVMLDPAGQWLDKQQGPFLAVYLTGTTHHPYWSPTRLGFEQFVDGEKDREKNRYLNAVRYLDWFVDRLLQKFKAAGLYDNTIFVIVGDHGESFGENSRRQHNASLYEETLSVPLLIHSPKWLAPGRDSRIVSLVDLMPSLLDLMGFDLVGKMTGRSFFGKEPSREYAIGSCWYDHWCLAGVDSRFKYIYNFNEKSDELYDLQADPNEATNLATQWPDLVARRRNELLQHHRENLARYDRYYRTIHPDYWSSRGDSVTPPEKLLSLAADDPRRKIDGY